MTSRHSLTIIVAFAVFLPTAALAHETDQYSVPVGREFADLRFHFSREVYDILVSAVRKTNARIARSLHYGKSTRQTARLQSPDVIADAVWAEFPPVVNHVETLEVELRDADVRARHPGLVIAYQPACWIYHHWALVLDPTKLIRLWRTSTIMVDGTYFGTDKFVHFVHMGSIMYSSCRKALADGLNEAEATRHAVSLGTGYHPLLSENTLLGMLTTGVRSNADLAANYAGLKFYRNLTEEVRVRGEMRPPMLVRDGPYWRLNKHVHPRSDFLTVFITDHWDEALNPNVYTWGMGIWLRRELRKRCDDLRHWYRDEHGAPLTRKRFAEIAEDLSTYYGEDYGHEGVLDELVSIANCCFENEEDSPLPRDAARDGTNEDVNTADRLGRTPLFWAARGGRTGEVERLIARGADVNLADIDGERPLHWAARYGRAATVQALLTHDADPNAASAYRFTPLHVATRLLAHDVIRTLLEHGADANARDTFGCSPLHQAAAHGGTRVVRMLLAGGANPSARDNYGTTPLHRAARGGHKEVVALFLSLGVDTKTVNALGHTPLDEARLSGHKMICELLAAAGSEPRALASKAPPGGAPGGAPDR